MVDESNQSKKEERDLAQDLGQEADLEVEEKIVKEPEANLEITEEADLEAIQKQS